VPWFVTLLVLLVACPGTPPGNFVRDADSGGFVKSGVALCAPARARLAAAAAPDADIAARPAPPPAPVEAEAAMAWSPAPPPAIAPRAVGAIGARAPPA
jgi:hypothetical protein